MAKKLVRSLNGNKPAPYRGIAGCARQAVVDSGLEGKMSPDAGGLYNDASGKGKRRIKWINGARKALTPAEEKKFIKALEPLVGSHGYEVKRYSFSRSYSGIQIYLEESAAGELEALRAQADRLGYRIVKK